LPGATINHLLRRQAALREVPRLDLTAANVGKISLVVDPTPMVQNI
jgi:hypothetical protein